MAAPKNRSASAGVGSPGEDVVELTDAKAIRAIAHPARLVVIDALYDRGLALTATQAAELAGTTPSAMSYHLRALERYGLVRHAAPTGDGRERPWVRVAMDLRIRPPVTAAVALATNAVVATAMDVTRARLLASLERSRDEQRRVPLDKVTTFSTNALLLSIDEAVGLFEAIQALLEPLREEHRKHAPKDAGRLTVVLAASADAEVAGRPGARSESKTDTDLDTQTPTKRS